MFCAASETVADMANGYILDPTSAFVIYPPTANTYSTTPAPMVSSARLQCTEVYMDELLYATQGYRTQQQHISELTLRSLKEIFSSLPAEAKDSVSIKKALQGDGDWKTTKEILGCMVDTDEGTLRLPPKRKAELGTLLEIPPLQRRISTKKIERLIGKVRSMNLAVPGAVGHFYNLPQSLTAAHPAHCATAYITKGFHSDLRFWRRLCADMPTRPTYLAKFVQRLPTDIGFADA